MKWAESQNIDLFRVEFVVAFGNDFSMSVWFFYMQHHSINENQKNGFSDKLKKKFLEILTKF